MAGLRDWAAIAVMAGMALLAACVRAEDDTCSAIKVLNVCKTDQGPPEPGDGQVVYLQYPELEGYWWYPKYNSRMSYWQHPTRTITESKDSWPKWNWLDCKDDYVCLESAMYPNYYLGAEYDTGNMAILYSDDPSHDDRVRLSPDFGNSTSKGLETKFALKKFESDTNAVSLNAYIYIPPRCEGYQQVAAFTNPSSSVHTYKLTFENGVVRSEVTTSDKRVASDTVAEVNRGIRTASLSGHFSQTWANERAKALSAKDTHELTFPMEAGTRNSIWQKVARYGMYEWRSSVLVRCEEGVVSARGKPAPLLPVV